MDNMALIQFGGMMFYLVVPIFDTGRFFLEVKEFWDLIKDFCAEPRIQIPLNSSA